MASSLRGPGMTGVPSPRIINLEFPPPPPYPPPHNQILRNSLMEPVSPIMSPVANSHQHSLLDYSYAYYHQTDHPDHFHVPYSTDVLSQQQQQQQQQPSQQLQEQQQQQQIISRQSQQQPQAIRSDPLKRHTYTTCYGTEENIYEEISEISKQCHRGLHGSRRSLVAEEVRRVQSRHRRVLGELNLSVEAMLMPTAVENNEEQPTQETHGTSTEELLPSVSPTDDLNSRVGCDKDSGFSGSYSSNASYRSGLGSLRRGMGKISSGPESAQRKMKAAMIWKKGWKGWKKFHSFGHSGSGGGGARISMKFSLGNDVS
ncbi:myb-like protein AA [Pseudomyrmex gracilis]|uniref:myb-like protein AA n=1 Tax=Pseudomyrmex gracilis TaxID=219809 RepID=UPI0009953599|nr:myb-like protein AA [Pseudomyrmex gracilis]